MRCSRQPRPSITACRRRSRSRAALEEWYMAPSHSTPSRNRPVARGSRTPMSMR